MKECPTCAGCGQVANDEDRTPWKYWEDLPIQSAVAVQAGWISPCPCPQCGGTGKVEDGE